jgi:RNA polymerase sigma-70 factor (ECF subfamily)
LREEFAHAIRNDDLEALKSVLAVDIVLLADSGGKAPAAILPVRGPDHVGRLLIGLARKSPLTTSFERAFINGSPGFVISIDGTVVQTLAIDVADGQIIAIYVTRNPEKLRAIAPSRAT